MFTVPIGELQDYSSDGSAYNISFCSAVAVKPPGCVHEASGPCVSSVTKEGTQVLAPIQVPSTLQYHVGRTNKGEFRYDAPYCGKSKLK